MSGDKQDFLERQEARRRRMQQRLGPERASGRSSQTASSGNKAVSRSSADGARSAARSKSGATKPPAQAGPKRKADSLENRLLADNLEGRRAAASREELAGLTPLPQRPKPALLARLIIWGTAAICGLLLLATIAEAWTVHRLNQQITTNQQAADQLQAQNQQLSRAVQQLQQASTIEQEARRLGFIFPGDQPVVIITTTPPAPPSQHATAPSPGWWGFWPDWLKLFFGG